MSSEELRANHKSVRRWKCDSPRYEGAKRDKVQQNKPKKITPEKAFPLVVNVMKQGIGSHSKPDPESNNKYLQEIFYAELIAIHLNIQTHIVKQVFHKLNLLGILSKRELWEANSMHTRNDYDDVIQWEAKRYYVYPEKLRDFKC